MYSATFSGVSIQEAMRKLGVRHAPLGRGGAVVTEMEEVTSAAEFFSRMMRLKKDLMLVLGTTRIEVELSDTTRRALREERRLGIS